MRTLVLALLIALSVSAFAAEHDPDFSWGAKSTAQVRASLDLAQAKWREASAVPKSPECLRSPKQTSFDEHYLRELLGRPDQAQIPYCLLDAAAGGLKRLDECKALYARALAGAGKPAPDSAKRFDDSYHLLRSRLKLATGIARALVSQRMAASSTSSYCYQAMESAIDALRDAADDARKVSGGAKRADSILKLRSTLFDAWERAQRARSTDPIGEIDLRKAFDESGLLTSDGRAQSRL